MSTFLWAVGECCIPHALYELQGSSLLYYSPQQGLQESLSSDGLSTSSSPPLLCTLVLPCLVLMCLHLSLFLTQERLVGSFVLKLYLLKQCWWSSAVLEGWPCMGSALWELLVVSLAPEHNGEQCCNHMVWRMCLCTQKSSPWTRWHREILCLYKMAFICFLSFQLLCVMQSIKYKSVSVSSCHSW